MFFHVIARIDTAVLRRIEVLSHLVERLTGKDCFEQRDLIRWAIPGSLIAQAIVTARGPRIFGFVIAGMLLLVAGVWTLVMLSWRETQKSIDQWVRRGVLNGLSNPGKNYYLNIYTRCFLLNMTALTAVAGTFQAPILLYSLHAYLDACDPLGPRGERLRLPRLTWRKVASATART